MSFRDDQIFFILKKLILKKSFRTVHSIAYNLTTLDGAN